MATDAVHPKDAESWLANLPVAVFAMVMGLCGLALAWQKASIVLDGVDPRIPTVIAAAAAALFLVLMVAYGAKIAAYPGRVRDEYLHPEKLHFLPAVSVSLLLLSILALTQWPAAAFPLLAAGAGLHLLLMLVVMNSWFNRDHFLPAHLNPAWFIPSVGNVIVPLSAVTLGYVELSWFFFAIGIVFWVVLFTIITNRVLFHNPLPERLAPTLFILIAPPAVGFLSYVKLTGALDPFARVLYYFALFMTLFLLTEAPRLLRAPFFLSWWAYSFPLAAATVASFTMSEMVGARFLLILAEGLLGLVTLVVAGLVVRTLIAFGRGEICVPD